MDMTFEEVKDALKRLDEITLLETLNLSSEELVELLEEYIEKDFDYYKAQVSTEADQAA